MLMLSHVLQHHPRRPVDDALGRAGGARGKEDEQGMIEGESLEGEFGALAGGEKLNPGDGAGDGSHVGLGVQVGDHHHPPQGGKALDYLG